MQVKRLGRVRDDNALVHEALIRVIILRERRPSFCQCACYTLATRAQPSTAPPAAVVCEWLPNSPFPCAFG
jgi:hypothetical protein